MTVNVLYIGGLRFNGRNVGLKEVVFAFNHAAQQADGSDGVHVLDIFYPLRSHFALIQMRSKEAAKRAKERLHRSWLFEKYIVVDFGRKSQYVHFASDRTHPSPLVIKLFSKSHSTETSDNAKTEKDEAESTSKNKPQLQEVFIVKMPMGVSRHFRPGTVKPDGMNNRFISTLHEEEDEREVVRDRLPESPVLFITGIETRKGRPLTRFDLIQLFSCYGEVVDCGVFLRRVPSNASGCAPARPFALVQMNDCEQAARAMHSLDYTWQMGRFIKVTYSRERSILVTNSFIKSKYRLKASQKGNE